MAKRVIKFGTWNNEPMEWEVLFEDEFKLFVISKNSIGRRVYSSNNNASWAEADIRKYLNRDFLEKTFSSEEKRKVMSTKLTDVDTKDNIFLISKAAVNDYLSQNDWERRAYWCTRSKGENTSSIIRYNGTWGSNEAKASYHIYPAMYLKK